MKILITGSFSFTGSYITKELLTNGYSVRTLTNHPNREYEFINKIEVFSYNFSNFDKLVEAFQGVDVFINTYWIRFPKHNVTWNDAIENSKLLFKAAKASGVKLILHLSVTNPSLVSPYSYFKGKALVEDDLLNCGVPSISIRPALIYEKDDILINNMTYLLRKFPVFALFGNGSFLVQPIAQGDLAKIIVDIIDGKINDLTFNQIIINTLGPQTYQYVEMIKILRTVTNTRSWIIKFPGFTRWIAFSLSKIIGWLKNDVILTKEEMMALQDNLLYVEENESNIYGTTDFNTWVIENADKLGIKYAHEIRRHYI
jgi:uncharacterized protein YbjT (DUF2867 family)